MESSVGPLDFRCIEIELELSALDYHLNFIEDQIKKKEFWEKKLSQRRIKKQGLTPDDPEWHYEQNELDYTVEFLVPKLFRSTFLVSLYAVYESAVIEIAEIIQKREAFPVSINDLKGDFLKRARKYYQIMGFQLSSDKAWERIIMLSDLRNAIAHANGRIEMLKEKTRSKIEEWEKQNIGICSMHGFLFLEESFLRDTFNLVSDSLNDLIKRYKIWDDNFSITQEIQTL